MKWLLFFILIFSCIRNAECQSYAEGTFDIHFIPLPLIDRNPRLRLGMEYHGFDKLGYSLEVGFGNSHLNHAQLSKTVFGKEYKFFEIQSELKWYVIGQRAFSKYFAADVFYMHMKDKLVNGYYYPAFSENTVRFEEASFRKQKIGLLVKGGFKFLIWQRIVVDFYEGFGFALRDIQYTDLAGTTIDEFHFNEEWYPHPHLYEGKAWVFQFATGIKVGCVIAKMK